MDAEKVLLKMKKIIYEGSDDVAPYTPSTFGPFMKGLGAENGSLPSSNLTGYHLDGVTVLYRYTGFLKHWYLTGGTCSVELLGDKDKVGAVERIILAEQERVNTTSGIHLGMQE